MDAKYIYFHFRAENVIVCGAMFAVCVCVVIIFLRNFWRTPFSMEEFVLVLQFFFVFVVIIPLPLAFILLCKNWIGNPDHGPGLELEKK